MKWYCFSILLSVTVMLSCTSNMKSGGEAAMKRTYTSPCGCTLSEQQMINYCPVDAVGDSILICKVGTNNVIGSGRPAMKWTEYIQSEYFGGEGMLVNCKTGDTIFPGLYNRVISYHHKKLIVDERKSFDVYNKTKNAWVNIDLPVWRKIVSAVNSEIMISKDSFILKPPFQDRKVFAIVADEFVKEEKSSDHHMISNLPGRLLICAINGDTLSANRLLNFKKLFSAYFANSTGTDNIVENNVKMYKLYSAYLGNGGKREYFDLTKYVYFKNGSQGK